MNACLCFLLCHATWMCILYEYIEQNIIYTYVLFFYQQNEKSQSVTFIKWLCKDVSMRKFLPNNTFEPIIFVYILKQIIIITIEKFIPVI